MSTMTQTISLDIKRIIINKIQTKHIKLYTLHKQTKIPLFELLEGDK